MLLLFPTVTFSQTLELGTLSSFEAYTGVGAVTNSGTFTGDVGTNNGIISGFGSPPSFNGTIHNNNALTVQARIDLLRVYIHLSDIFVTHPGTHAPAFGSGETITSGVYSIGGAGSIAGTLTLDGGGNPDAIFIMKFEGAFTAGVGSTIVLSNGARACNVFWIAEGAISIGASSVIIGTLFSHPGAISLGENSTIEGRLLASEGAITIGAGGVAIAPVGPITIPIKCLGKCISAPSVDVLGSVAKFALFSSAGAVANAATSGIVGDIGAHAGAISGFSTSTQVGSVYNADAITAQAKIDLDYAYSQLILIPITVFGHTPAFGSGETITAGVYYIGGAGSLAGTITLDGQNNPDAIFIFRFNGAFSIAAQSKVIFINGTRRCNVFWISEGATDLGTFTYMKGTLLAHGGACSAGANANVEGRMLSTAGAVGFSTGVIYNDALCFGDDTPISGGNQTVCSNGQTNQTLTATATANTTNGTIVWYNAATGGSLVTSPTQIGVGSVTYYAASYNGTYYSTTRAAVTLTINPSPTQPTIACYETASFNTTTCSWDVTGTQPTQPTIDTTICQGSTITIGDKIFNTTGVYIVVITNSIGCDSIITLNLFAIKCLTNDVIRDTNQIKTIKDVCIPVEPIMTAHTTTILDNCGATHSNNQYSINAGTTCINVIRDSTVTIDTLCVVVCDTVKNICDTSTVIFSNTPKVDTIIYNVCGTCTQDTICTKSSVGMTITTVIVDRCNSSTPKITVVSIPGTTCVSIVRDSTTITGIDTICVIKCDGISGLCDTTVIIINILPVHDVIRDTDQIRTIKEVCIPLDPGMTASTITILENCGATHSGNIYTTKNGTTCITVTRDNIGGYNIDTLCVVVCDVVKNICDTSTIIFSNTPKVDTIRDTNFIRTTDTICMPIEIGMDGHSIEIVDCGHTINSDNTYEVIKNTTCIKVVRGTEVGLNIDTLCIVVCDVIRGICDTTKVLISTKFTETPPIIIDTLSDSTPIKTIVTICKFKSDSATNTVVTLCDGGLFGSGVHGTWTIDVNGCLVYTAGPIKGNDTLCVKSCDSITLQCSETTVIITVTGLPPIAVDDSATATINTPITIPVLANDTTRDGDPLMLCDESPIVVDPIHGAVVVNDDGTVTYIPISGYIGIDSFQYQICDSKGRDSAWVYVSVRGSCDIPDAISPNGDGINDVFIIPCGEGDIVFNAYNRWGIEVYRSERYMNDWDGKYKGSPLPDGTYYYVVKYSNSGGEEVNRAGFITIHR